VYHPSLPCIQVQLRFLDDGPGQGFDLSINRPIRGRVSEVEVRTGNMLSSLSQSLPDEILGAEIQERRTLRPPRVVRIESRQAVSREMQEAQLC
jgi:hypothetical protein